MKKIITWLLMTAIILNCGLPIKAFSDDSGVLASSSITISSAINGAVVYLNENEIGITPLDGPVKTPPGFYALKIQKEGHSTWREKILLSPGENFTANVLLLPLNVSDSKKEAFKKIQKEKAIYKKWWFWTLVAVAGAAAAGSGGGGGGNDTPNTGDATFTW